MAGQYSVLRKCVGAVVIVFYLIISSSSVPLSLEGLDNVSRVESFQDRNTNRIKRSVSSDNETTESSFLDFTTANIRRIFVNRNQTELKNQTMRIEYQLNRAKQDIGSIRKEMEFVNPRAVSFIANIIEETNNSLNSLLQHLLKNSNDWRGYDDTKMLLNLETVINSLQGSKDADNVDILATLRDALKCHGRKLLGKVNSVLKFTIAGLWVHDQYQRMRNPFELISSQFEKFFTNKTVHLLKRLDEEVLKCRMDERNVKEEMRQDIETNSNNGTEALAVALLKFLEDKYDSKKWSVLVLRKALANHQYVQSEKFHTVSVDGISAFAISSSVDFETVDDKLAGDFERTFKFPLKGKNLEFIRDVSDVNDYLSRYLTPLRNRMEVETLVIRVNLPNCAKPLKNEFVAIKSSKGMKVFQLVKKIDDTCLVHLAMVVPVSRNSSSFSEQRCRYRDKDGQSGLLRNEAAQAYLSVNDNTNGDGMYIILLDHWRNDAGQRWRFVDNLLTNGFDKCLTATGKQNSNVKQEKCSANSSNQLWDRNGLQIINRFQHQCLAFKGIEGNAPNTILYVVQKDCESTPPFLWYDWDKDCEDAVIHSLTLTNIDEFYPLRNEFSKRYLSVDKEMTWVKYEPWNNLPKQRWQFKNGQLRNNQNRECLRKSSVGSFLILEDCEYSNSAQEWRLNVQNQIINGDNKTCLSLSKDDKIHHEPCKDVPAHRWRMIQKPKAQQNNLEEILEKEIQSVLNLAQSGSDTYLLDENLDQTEDRKTILLNLANVRRIFQKRITDRNVLTSRLAQVENELKETEKYFEPIRRELETANLRMNSYSANANKIKSSLVAMREYLNDPKKQRSQDKFYEKAAALPTTLEAIIGDLGHNSKLDITTALRNATECSVIETFHEKIKTLSKIAMVGLWVHSEYQRIKYVPNSNSSHFKTSFMESSNLLLKRLDSEVLNCRMDERNVTNEMRQMLEDNSNLDQRSLADALLRSLERKYYVKKWIVFLFPRDSVSSGTNYILSEGFHNVSVQDSFAVAFSLNQDIDAGFPFLANTLISDFKFPIETSSGSVKSKENAQDIYQHFNKHLAPLRKEVESIVITTPCQTVQSKTEDFYTVLTSDNFKWTRIINQDSCGNKQIIAIPLFSQPNTSTPIDPDSKCYEDVVNLNLYQNASLRNGFHQAYLSVKDNLSVDGTAIILDREFRNEAGQRWQFVNNQLKNDHGKCLTAWNRNTWYLYQYDCSKKWDGQIWIRHGLQIINGYRFCLAFYETKENGSIKYAFQDYCNSTPPFLWYHWGPECEGGAII